MTDQAQFVRFGLFDARVPRYTSYPTAPQFSTAIGPDDFTGWIESVPAGARISLYLHVPFCRRLCWFCACRTQGTHSDAPVKAYAETLKSEIALLSRHLADGVTLSRLHWGGGTPTLLSPELIRDLTRTIFDVTPLAPNGEFSVEIDPDEIDEARLDALVEAGLNRASIGVQDFDPEIQRAIGREQSYELTARVVRMIRDRGVPSLNADILYGLPHQTGSRITHTVDQLLSLDPDRVALYGYAHVPWISRRQQLIPSEAMPTPQERLGLFETASALFEAQGYQPIGIDHFARPGDGLARAARAGKLHRNFQGYTDDDAPTLIGLGASSISRFAQGYAQNAPGTSDHTKAIRDGGFSTRRGHTFSDEDLLRGRIIEALMCDFAVDLAELDRNYSFDRARHMPLFKVAAKTFGDLVRLDADRFEIAPQGRPLTRMVAQVFDAYDTGSAKHSAAI